MSADITLYHHSSPGQKIAHLPAGFWQLGTCLRSIVISSQSETLSQLQAYEAYHGEAAYEFLLQTICGLHSPLVGETEILGQFKDFVKKHKEDFSSDLLRVMQNLLKDCKKLRTQHLQNLGCTSYGSLLRKHLKGNKQGIDIMGAGSLVSDILPWVIKNQNHVRIFTRTPSRHEDLKKHGSGLELAPLSQIQAHASHNILIVAAPIDSSKISQYIDINQYEIVFDLRGECEKDPLHCDNVITLPTLFADIELNRKQAQVVKKTVLQEIGSITEKMSLFEKQRPFGWEDLWSYA